MDSIIAQFKTDGAAHGRGALGNGHINSTALAEAESGKKYVLQRINTAIFQNVDGLMQNIVAVTRHLAQKDPDPRHVLRLVPTRSGDSYFRDENGDCYRMYEFIENSICLEMAQNADDFRQSAVAFGHFQSQLADFPADTLVETIPRFHDTPFRFEQLDKAIADDASGRLREVQPEIEFAMRRREEAGAMVEMLRRGELPLRVTHNDTKLNNVMLDAETRAPLCVVDLDTVMPGLAGNDFGDSIRFGASTAAEDERDLNKVHMSMELYRAYANGFLSACPGLSRAERETLPLASKLMTLECGIRFLADHIAGDTYFHIARPGHNLDRCRTQFKLIESMEAQWDEMRRAIDEIG